ncbi:hypothetical protein [uncultured Sphingomonas sp.]|uniref:hypothetical protein n=1 Tax=uncultured Sphingomonas sp. TaxID=158754 RepID=UPI0035CA5895
MGKPDPIITGLDDADRALLVDALAALRDQRGRDWNAACDRAERLGEARPSLTPFEIDPIVQLARRLGGDAKYRLER